MMSLGRIQGGLWDGLFFLVAELGISMVGVAIAAALALD